MTRPQQERRRRPGGPASAWMLAAAAVALAFAVVAALIGRGSSTDAEAVGGAAAVSHVHGLGVNPGDGELYAATHHGVFRVPEGGDAELVGVPRDTMGFTIVGDDHFLASGHPAFRGDPLFERGLPPLLGLIESLDGGRTWQPRSLFGEADFHALAAVHGAIYGFDATSERFLVSADGETWDVRAHDLTLSDFAVDPDDPDRLVAMTDGGLVESGDGGRSWDRLAGPAVVFLSWGAEEGLWGADSDGAVFTRTPAGWEARGQLAGLPQALLVAEGRIHAAVSDGHRTGIYVSDDGGRSWQLLYRDAA
jgi:hypothetical protein